MISSKFRVQVNSSMKNVEIVPEPRYRGFQAAADSHGKSGPTIEELRNKYLSDDYDLPLTRSGKKEDDDIEVVLIKERKPGGQDHNGPNEERTIIGSGNKGILGSQG